MLAVASLAQDTGTISGTVVDEKGEPVVDAKVNASLVDGRPMSSLIRYVETDANGHFTIDRLEFGRYRVFAKKVDAGYPDTSWSFYSGDAIPVVAITPSSPIAERQIQLTPKAGILMGSITNAVTGAPVNVAFKLSRASQPEKFISTSARPKYRVLLPDADVLVEVSAQGFKTWNPGHPVHLQPGSEMDLDILLEPMRDSSLRRSRFLVPEGYVGWLQLEYGLKDASSPATEDGVKVFKFPAAGMLKASGAGPEPGPEDDFMYYSENGSRRPISNDYKSNKGMIWGNYAGSVGGLMSLYGFFVGTEEQYNKYKSQATHPGPRDDFTEQK
jgi:uncharacterized protein DUF6843/carboxypeptidase family protein